MDKYTELKVWCQKVLPLVYDDSLSYYELLCKVLKKLNDLGITFNEFLEWIENELSLRPTKEFINKNMKLSDNGNFTGSWFGLNKPTMSEEGMRATVEKIVNEDLPYIQTQIKQTVAYISDNTVGNNIPVDKPYTYDYLREQQSLLLSTAFKMIRNDELLNLCCIGDSTTYGHDTVSGDKRGAGSDPTLDPSQTHTYTQASITYPEALQNYFLQMNFNIKVKNRGYSGDTTQLGYSRWTTPSGANLSFVMYGLNDYGRMTLEEFKENYTKIISREILRGSAVIILTPFKTMQPKINIDCYSNVLHEIGKTFNIPVIEMDLMMDNYSASIHSDDFHLNGIGYRMIGARLTSLVVGEGCNNPNYIKSGDKILTRQITDNCSYKGGASLDSNGAMDTPDEVYQNIGFACKMVETNSRIYFSFYTTEDDLVIIPDLFKSGISSATVELDFNTVKPKNSLSYSKDRLNTSNDEGIVYKFTVDTDSIFTKFALTGMSDKRYIYVAKRGWHILSITKTIDTGTYYVRGLDVLSYENYTSLFKKGYYKLPSLYNVNSTSVNVLDICHALDVVPINSTNPNDYWSSIACRISIHSYDQAVVQYVFNLSNINFDTNWSLSKNNMTFNLTESPTAVRTLTSISFNTETKQLTFNWGGTQTKTAYAVITIA